MLDKEYISAIIFTIYIAMFTYDYFKEKPKDRVAFILLNKEDYHCDNFPSLGLLIKEWGRFGIYYTNTVGIFDKNMHDYIGYPTDDEFIKMQKEDTYVDFSSMDKNEFVSRYGKYFDNEESCSKKYNNYKIFAFSQLYGRYTVKPTFEFYKSFLNDVYDEEEMKKNYDELVSR